MFWCFWVLILYFNLEKIQILEQQLVGWLGFEHRTSEPKIWSLDHYTISNLQNVRCFWVIILYFTHENVKVKQQCRRIEICTWNISNESLIFRPLLHLSLTFECSWVILLYLNLEKVKIQKNHSKAPGAIYVERWCSGLDIWLSVQSFRVQISLFLCSCFTFTFLSRLKYKRVSQKH